MDASFADSPASAVPAGVAYRIATGDPRTQLGQPEIQLGLIPAAGGTQRLPRLVGIAAALDVILAGKSLKPKKALKLGLVDLGDVIALVEARPEKVHLILSGRHAHEEVVRRAHLVTEMRNIKHPYELGIEAEKGIDY